jgi:hypothetical protein
MALYYFIEFNEKDLAMAGVRKEGFSLRELLKLEAVLVRSDSLVGGIDKLASGPLEEDTGRTSNPKDQYKLVAELVEEAKAVSEFNVERLQRAMRQLGRAAFLELWWQLRRIPPAWDELVTKRLGLPTECVIASFHSLAGCLWPAVLERVAKGSEEPLDVRVAVFNTKQEAVREVRDGRAAFAVVDHNPAARYEPTEIKVMGEPKDKFFLPLREPRFGALACSKSLAGKVGFTDKSPDLREVLEKLFKKGKALLLPVVRRELDDFLERLVKDVNCPAAAKLTVRCVAFRQARVLAAAGAGLAVCVSRQDENGEVKGVSKEGDLVVRDLEKGFTWEEPHRWDDLLRSDSYAVYLPTKSNASGKRGRRAKMADQVLHALKETCEAFAGGDAPPGWGHVRIDERSWAVPNVYV